MSDNKMEKEVEGFLTETVVMLFQTIKDILKGLWYGIKKLKTAKAIIGFTICLLLSVGSYFFEDKVVSLLEKIFAPQYIIRILLMILLLMPILYLIVIGRMEDKNKDHFLQIFKDINFKARDGKYPYFCAMRKDGKKVIYIFKANIPLEEWKTNKTRLETALNCNILLISNGEDKKIVKLTTVPNHCKISEMLYWSDEFASKQNGVITVGQGALQEVTFDLNRTPHVLIAGETGSGKSVILRTCLRQTILQGCRAFMIDFKGGVEFGKRYEQFGEVITDRKRALEVLTMLVEENQYRLTLFRDLEVKNLNEYNKKTKQNLSRIIVVSDEIAEMLDKKGVAKEDKVIFEQLEGKIATLARLSRATGINLLLGVQRPDANVLPGQIKNNIPVRISGRFADKAASEIVLGNTDATDLPDIKGRFLYKVGNETIEFQSYYFDDDTMLKPVSMEVGDMLMEAPTYNPNTNIPKKVPRTKKENTYEATYEGCNYTEEEMEEMEKEVLDWGNFKYDKEEG